MNILQSARFIVAREARAIHVCQTSRAARVARIRLSRAIRALQFIR